MQETTEVQHKTSSYSRIEKDKEDTENILAYLKPISPFSINETSLRNITNGVLANDDVNVSEVYLGREKVLMSFLSLQVLGINAMISLKYTSKVESIFISI